MPARATTPEDEKNKFIPWPPSPEKPLTELEKKRRRLREIEEAMRECVQTSTTLLADQSYLAPKPAPVPPVARKPPAVKSTPEERARRLKLIEEAFAATSDEPAPPTRGAKRASDASLHDENAQPAPAPAAEEPKPKKARRTNPFAEQQQDTPRAAASPTPVPAPAKPESKLNIKQRVTLSEEQQHVLQLVLQGKSVFFTGSAGTGKSVLLREIIRSLKLKYNKAIEAVAVTASTGIAACNIGGVTLHSFAGFGLGTGTVEQLVKYVKRNKKTVQKWTRTKVLIIDEISMVDGELFDKIVRIARLMRKNPNGMGGMQLVVTGDFFQLPPVAKGGSNMVFSFDAETWDEVIQHTFNLTKVFRQKDQTFVDMLNEMRFGSLSADSVKRFRSLSRSIDWGDGIEPTELFPLRANVDNANMQRLQALPGKTVCFTAVDGGSLQDATQRDKMLSNFMAPKELSLKLNCQVMLIKNTDETLVNGSMGKVIAFRTPAEHHTIVTGLPSEEGGDAAKKAANKGKVYPLVRFSVFDAMHNKTTHRDVLVQPDSWKVEGQNGEVVVSRTQIPLILAWAMSIHKSQGQTLDRVRVDLGKVFEKGQAYVALSRATSLQGLQVQHFDPARVMAHPRVIEWSATLETMPERESQ